MILAMTALAAAQAATAVETKSDLRDCAVMAAVARDHLGLDKEMGPPLLPSGDYLPSCPWEALGLKPFAEPGGRDNYWLRFQRPIYDGAAARIEVGIMWGTRSGYGSECELQRVGRQWKLVQCGRTWVS